MSDMNDEDYEDWTDADWLAFVSYVWGEDWNSKEDRAACDRRESASGPAVSSEEGQ